MIIEVDENLPYEMIEAIERAVKPFGYVFYDFAQGAVVTPQGKEKHSTMMALVKES
jgi:hypothetical protein